MLSPHSNPKGFPRAVMRECLSCQVDEPKALPSTHRVQRVVSGCGDSVERAAVLPMLQMWAPQRRQHGNQGSTPFSKGLRSAKSRLDCQGHRVASGQTGSGCHVEQWGRMEERVGSWTAMRASEPMDHIAVSLGRLAFVSLSLSFHLRRGC